MISTIFGMWTLSGPAVIEDMHNCTSLKSLMFKKQFDFTCNEFDTTLAPL